MKRQVHGKVHSPDAKQQDLALLLGKGMNWFGTGGRSVVMNPLGSCYAWLFLLSTSLHTRKAILVTRDPFPKRYVLARAPSKGPVMAQLD